jgi:glutamyl aminopeptidase
MITAGDSQSSNKRSLYERNGVAVCSQKRALAIAAAVFASLFTISLIIAFAGPQNGEYNIYVYIINEI